SVVIWLITWHCVIVFNTSEIPFLKAKLLSVTIETDKARLGDRFSHPWDQMSNLELNAVTAFFRSDAYVVIHPNHRHQKKIRKIVCHLAPMTIQR
ncbi:hypothetical protein, partial [Pseudomonas zeae]|uniref:hypothetical protein n=1 Tax=Pseudomonas zeae TaxID=2745510 RepID=UPI0039DF8E21